LTESTLLDSTQLVRQAETIAGLATQRDFLVAQAEEERERWESEKDGWARMAEALIAQRNRTGHNAAKDAVGADTHGKLFLILTFIPGT
jgi:hypothetical protein